ncbi:oligopeptide/dipeptide ABC transporter ATPase [Mycobacteroides abscessus subsp. abscessus]|nr:oligopeptide/dipeptide ABC transporter ATPase [Mycobacteroides abscessus subsp. abscessus]
MQAEATNEVLRVSDVIKHYKERKAFKHTKIKSVDGVSFTLNKGEILGIIGESGCGKSTLGKVLVKLEDATSGDIQINGTSVEALFKQNELQFRRTVQMIFQNPFDTFDPRYSIAKILTNVMKLHKIGANEEERMEISKQRLEEAGLKPAEDFLHRYPHELSGGQLQRISILRSMLLNPSFIVADEPVSMLDVSIRADIINMLKKICDNHQTAMVFISHDITTTRYISDRIAVMYLGRIVETGTTDEVLHNPKHPYTQALISNSSYIEEEEVIQLNGEPPTPNHNHSGCYFYQRCYKRKSSCQNGYPETIDLGDGHLVSCPHG